MGLRRKVWRVREGGRVGGLVWKVDVVGVGVSRKVCLTTTLVLILRLGFCRGILYAFCASSRAGMRWTMCVVGDMLGIGF